ncbi:MAG: metallophosphatase family protein [Euryarchaeota archaeon]|nr:metallophosphatase family protein [Euryarchaeota archaeon]
MKIGLIADIHSNLLALEAALERLRNIDEIICIGDIVGYGNYCNECVNLIKQRRIPTVTGNHEWAVVTGDTSWFNPVAAEAIQWTIDHITKENLDYISKLPTFLRRQIDKYSLYVVHGSPRSPIEEYIFPDVLDGLLEEFLKQTQANVLVMGHTHVPFIRKLGRNFVINPGAIGQPRDNDPRASFMILDIENEKIEIEQVRVEYQVAEAARAIERAGLPPLLAQRLYYGW